MAIVEIKDLKAVLPRGKRLLGIDPGEKTWGLAISDPTLLIASPLKTIERTKFGKDVPKLSVICKEYGVGGFIIGLPVNMDGSLGPRAQAVRDLALNFLSMTDVLGFEPVIAFWDERLSTSAVERFMIEQADTSRARRDKIVDKSAAAWILQGALDRLCLEK
jgi:putative Holliday junction resolvase